MDFLNKTLFASSDDDLKRIYDEEHKKLQKNELIIECVEKLSISDLKSDIPEESKKNIEKALLAARISDFIDLNGQTLLGLDDFKLSQINLTYSEQKIVREKVQDMVNKELKRRKSHMTTDSLEKKIDHEQNKFIQLEKQNRELMLKLEELKRESLGLMKEVATTFIGSDQKELVKGLKEDTEVMELKSRKYMEATEKHQCNLTKYSHNVLKEISGHLDELLEKKNNEK